MRNTQVKLLHHTPLFVCAKAIRTCWNSHAKSDNGGDIDKELIARVGNKNKHSSTLEHLVYTFEIKGISRACLQELARHRIASLSVKSSRYTLKELKNLDITDTQALEKLFVKCGEWDQSFYSLIAKIQYELTQGTSNDIVKYLLPESFRTSLVWTINARSLQNFLSLRTSRSALEEIQKLAYRVFDNLPKEHKYLFEDFLADSANIKDN